MKIELPLLAFLLLSCCLHAQQVTGTVLDAGTGRVLSYVHVGIEQLDRGTISNDRGLFRLDAAGLSPDDSVRFSMIGYETRYLEVSEIRSKPEVRLTPVSYGLNKFTLTAPTTTERILLGADTPSKTTTGESGTTDFGRGWEWGIRISYPEQPYYLKTVDFHTHFNTVDSALFRIHVYTIRNGLPDRPLLTQAAYTTSRKKDKWISADLREQNILVEEDIVVTYELVRIWYGRKDRKNALFYTHSADSSHTSFYRPSSFANWEVDTRTPPALYLRGIAQ